MNAISYLSLAASAAALIPCTAFAGHPIADPSKDGAAKECCSEERSAWFPRDPGGSITIGGKFSEDASGGYVDSITGLWASSPRDLFIFLNSRYSFEDNDQFISSTGLAVRKLLPGQDVIIGGNVFWDAISSARGNDFNQLGLGLEVLTKWVDFRFNYYLPENNQYVFERSSTRSDEERLGPISRDGGVRSQERIETRRTRNFERREAALEGFNTEIGFLLPGVDRYAEVRLFGGYYHYENPFGGDYQGFKARLEAHLLPGVIADAEYWDDAALMGGHWTAGVRVSVPFSIHNLVTGRNPFEGAGEMFRPRTREFKERMSEMIIRSHRIQTVSSSRTLVSDRTTTDKSTVRLGSATPVRTPESPRRPGFPIE